MSQQINPADFKLNEMFDVEMTRTGEFRTVSAAAIGADPDYDGVPGPRREEKCILTRPDGRWAETWLIVDAA